MSPVQNLNPAMLRVDYSRADKYIYPEPPKMTFGQKLGRFFGKLANFALPIAGAVAPFFGPLGLPVAAGCYGLNRFTQDSMAKSDMKRQIDVANQPQPTNIQMPGFFDQGPLQAGKSVTEFMAPKSFEPSINNVIIERNSAALAEMTKI